MLGVSMLAVESGDAGHCVSEFFARAAAAANITYETDVHQCEAGLLNGVVSHQSLLAY